MFWPASHVSARSCTDASVCRRRIVGTWRKCRAAERWHGTWQTAGRPCMPAMHCSLRSAPPFRPPGEPNYGGVDSWRTPAGSLHRVPGRWGVVLRRRGRRERLILGQSGRQPGWRRQLAGRKSRRAAWPTACGAGGGGRQRRPSEAADRAHPARHARQHHLIERALHWHVQRTAQQRTQSRAAWHTSMDAPRAIYLTPNARGLKLCN